MISRRILIAATFIFIGLFFAQTDLVAQKASKLYEEAEMALYQERFDEALRLYAQIAETDPGYEDIAYKTEICSLLSQDHRTKPMDTFLEFAGSYGKDDKAYQYWLGHIYAHKYKLPEAVQAWKTFRNDNILEEDWDLVARAGQLVYYFENPDNYEIHRLEKPVNSQYAELTPVYAEYRKELLFASDRKNPIRDEFRIYSSFHTMESGWKSPVELAALGTFSQKNTNMELVSADRRLFIFKEDQGGSLFYSQSTPSGWLLPVEFDSEISSAEPASHFFINEHEDRIIFTRKSKDAGLDLYGSFKDPETGKWNPSYLLSPEITSPYNEDSPFLSHDEQKLYFSSDRPGGLGGYDIYVSYLDTATYTWSTPENMGWPINSPDDEIHFKFNPDQNSGYFSSDRIPSQGDFDIYFFWEISKVKIEGRIIDGKTRQPISKGEIRFHPSQYLEEYFSSPISEKGKYRTEIIADETFKIEIVQDGNEIFTDYFEIQETGSENTTYLKDFTVSRAE